MSQDIIIINNDDVTDVVSRVDIFVCNKRYHFKRRTKKRFRLQVHFGRLMKNREEDPFDALLPWMLPWMLLWMVLWMLPWSIQSQPFVSQGQCN